MSRKERILQYLRENTQRFVVGGFTQSANLETASIARSLHLDRANVSKLLNELWNAGQAVKVQGRPTVYLSYRVLELAMPGQFIPNTVAQIEELLTLREEVHPSELLPEMHGESAPIWDCLRPLLQEAAVVCAYPPYGMPLLIVSPSYEDSEVLARQIFTRIKGTRPDGAKFVTIDCRGSLQGGSGFFQQLFGCSKDAAPGGRGIRSSFERSNHGMVFLVGIHRLPEYILEQLLTAIDRQTYCRMGETASRPLDATLVLTLPPQNNEELIVRLNKHIPCIQTVPSLDSRGADEKLELLVGILGQESFALGRPLRLDKDVLAYLLTAHYPAGISEMRSVVRLLCSAVLCTLPPDKESALPIACRHLPQRVVSDAECRLAQLQRILNLLSIIPNDYLFVTPDGGNEALRFLRGVWIRSSSLDALPDEEVFRPDQDRLLQPAQYIQDILDYLRGCSEVKIARLQKAIPYYILQHAARRLAQVSAEAEAATDPVLQLGLLLPMLTRSISGQRWKLPAGVLPPPGAAQAAVCQEIFRMFSPEDTLSAEEESFFAAYLAAAGGCTRAKQVSLLILCYGKGIASEYAALLRQYGPPGLSVAAVDVEMGKTQAEIIRQAIEIAGVLNRGGGIALTADMPLLLSLDRTITQQTGIPCRGLGEVSLSALLYLSEQCVSGRKLSELICRTPAQARDPAMSNQDAFMRRYLGEVFAPNLTFLDQTKAVSTLSDALTGILEDLHIPYSHEVAVKFLSHGSYMLERVISGRIMNFPNLRRFLAEQRPTASIVERRLNPVANTFGITIPAAEIAYIVEIFLELSGAGLT